MLVTLLTLWKAYQRFGWDYLASQYLRDFPNGGVTTEMVSILNEPLSHPLPIYSLYNVVLLPRHGILLGAGGVLLGESVFYPSVRFEPPERDLLLGAVTFDNVERDQTVVLCGVWDNLFWHWMTEFLVRAFLAEQSGFRGRYLISPSAPPFVRSSLELLGIASTRINTREEDTPLLLTTLVMPESLTGTAGHGRRSLEEFPQILLGLRTQILRWFNPNSPGRSRLFISRKRASRRRLLNEEEAFHLLEEYGFSLVILEEMELPEQIECISHAEALVGPHGAGFTHVLFMQPRSLVIEFFPPAITRDSNKTTIELLHHRHYQLSGHDEGRHDENEDFTVDLQKFKEILDLELR